MSAHHGHIRRQARARGRQHHPLVRGGNRIQGEKPADLFAETDPIAGLELGEAGGERSVGDQRDVELDHVGFMAARGDAVGSQHQAIGFGLLELRRAIGAARHVAGKPE